MQFILLLVLASAIAVGTVIYGRRAMRKNKKGSVKRGVLISVSAFGIVAAAIIILAATGTNVFAAGESAVGTTEASSSGLSLGDGFKYLAAALSTGLATIGTGMAVGSVGSSAIGAVSEDPSILGKTLIYVGMAEGIAIYGMIISILILFV